MAKTLRDQVVEALIEGFQGAVERTEVKASAEGPWDETLVWVRDLAEPIRVLPEDVILPDDIDPHVAGMIRLDIAALLSMIRDGKR